MPPPLPPPQGSNNRNKEHFFNIPYFSSSQHTDVLHRKESCYERNKRKKKKRVLFECIVCLSADFFLLLVTILVLLALIKWGLSRVIYLDHTCILKWVQPVRSIRNRKKRFVCHDYNFIILLLIFYSFVTHCFFIDNIFQYFNLSKILKKF